ncbi:hypothetical protein GYMLUDRAFT_762291 [Collybiopsis luxurians FD-317 M1]|uniref:Uncharacterized protein n=1 Tax=Collybiopsis luxurians FD-317 M1 TaxID=944289 RepID=A0A0D0BPZ2_9AGAR|nr:hypothetical protein GYMLUDRAFT_762291 [Collybiopsis luxurians FD-317 M1]
MAFFGRVLSWSIYTCFSKPVVFASRTVAVPKFSTSLQQMASAAKKSQRRNYTVQHITMKIWNKNGAANFICNHRTTTREIVWNVCCSHPKPTQKPPRIIEC